MTKGLQDAVTEAAASLLEKIRPDITVPQSGGFPPVKVLFRNYDKTLFAGNVVLIVRGGYGDEPNMRFLDVRVETPSGQSYGSAGYAFIGTKTEVMRYLESQQQDPAELIGAVRMAARTLAAENKA